MALRNVATRDEPVAEPELVESLFVRYRTITDGGQRGVVRLSDASEPLSEDLCILPIGPDTDLVTEHGRLRIITGRMENVIGSL